LSVGIDATSNTLIVSAQEEWLPSIEEMIKFLDDEAKPVRPTVEVFSTRIGSRELQAALSRALGESSSQVQIKEPASQPTPPPAAEQKPAAGNKAEEAKAGE
jgi:type II secretory pathway component GspD/PulD (secretin)